ncbi:peptidoglycan-recognition protein SC2-like [Glandiceps talaboti]
MPQHIFPSIQFGHFYKVIAVLVALVVTWFVREREDVMSVEIVKRSEWNARDVSERSDMASPVPYVILHHTHWKRCFNKEDCLAEMRKIQDFHIDGRGWWDIGYTFCIGEDGRVYEGRGWDTQGAHSIGYNAKSLGICILGDFMDVLPDKAALEATHKFLAHCVEQKKLSEDYILYGHRQARPTECPGNALFEHIKTWPHWEAGEHFPPSMR